MVFLKLSGGQSQFSELLRSQAQTTPLSTNCIYGMAGIACSCGFGDEERMRVTFQRNLGTSPSDYRKRLAGNLAG